MALYFNSSAVKYFCSCGQIESIYRLYFCRHCFVLKCSDCLLHEVDTAYCLNCLETVNASDARLQKNACRKCYDCPCCQHTLHVRAANQAVPDPDREGKMLAKKVYYLMCAACRWTTRDVGLADQATASADWDPTSDLEGAERIKQLIDYYKQLAVKERKEKEAKNIQESRRKFHFVTTATANEDKYRILGPALARQRASLLHANSIRSWSEEKITPPPKSVAINSDFNDLPDEIFTSVPKDVTSVKQRISCPKAQCQQSSQFSPIRKTMTAKQSLRCKVCEHNVLRPEFNPKSTKFKIQMVALLYVPEIRIMNRPETFVPGQPVQVVLTISNPLSHSLNVVLLPDFSEDSQTKGNSCSISLPQVDIGISARDDAAEFDDLKLSAGGGDSPRDDPSVIAFRKYNKIGIYIQVELRDAQATSVTGSFLLQYNYEHTLTTLQIVGAASQAKQPADTKVLSLKQRIVVDFGPSVIKKTTSE